MHIKYSICLWIDVDFLFLTKKSSRIQKTMLTLPTIHILNCNLIGNIV